MDLSTTKEAISGKPSDQSSKTILTIYFDEIRPYSPLTKTEEQDLADKIKQREIQAFEKLVTANLYFVIKIANRYHNRGLPYEDLLGEGNVGLVKAAHRFDGTRGIKFISYAVKWVEKFILKALSEQSIVRIPTTYYKKLKRIKAAESIAYRTLGREPNREEVYIVLCLLGFDLNPDQVLRLKPTEFSLDDKVAVEGARIYDLLHDDNTANPLKILLEREIFAITFEALSHLSDRHKVILRHHFGLKGYPRLTFTKIGEKIGLGRERTRQLKKQALEEMKELITYKMG